MYQKATRRGPEGDQKALPEGHLPEGVYQKASYQKGTRRRTEGNQEKAATRQPKGVIPTSMGLAALRRCRRLMSACSSSRDCLVVAALLIPGNLDFWVWKPSLGTASDSSAASSDASSGCSASQSRAFWSTCEGKQGSGEGAVEGGILESGNSQSPQLLAGLEMC